MAPTVIHIWLCFGQRSRFVACNIYICFARLRFVSCLSADDSYFLCCNKGNRRRLHAGNFVSALDFIYPKLLFRQFEEKRMLFQTKRALVFKAMYQSAFLAREKSAKFWRLIKRFWVNNFKNFFKNLLSTKSRTNHLKL